MALKAATKGTTKYCHNCFTLHVSSKWVGKDHPICLKSYKRSLKRSRSKSGAGHNSGRGRPAPWVSPAAAGPSLPLAAVPEDLGEPRWITKKRVEFDLRRRYFTEQRLGVGSNLASLVNLLGYTPVLRRGERVY